VDRRVSAGVACRLVLLYLVVNGCRSADITAPRSPGTVSSPSSTFAVTLSPYFPPPEASSGWRRNTSSAKLQSLGLDPTAVARLGAYTMSLPWENYYTGISGYDASNKASLVIKNGWIVGEFYNQASARTAVYALASNSKSFALMLLGRMLLEHPALGLTLQSRVYDRRWLAKGFPLSDSRKSVITFDELFQHTSGIIPEEQDPISGKGMLPYANWSFELSTVGHDADYPATRALYFYPGQPGTYSHDPYSSIGFNHVTLVFRQVTGMEPSRYLRRGILDPIGVGRVAFVTTPGMGDYVWEAAGGAMTSARDYARLAYLLLHEGDWSGNQIFSPSWIRQFTSRPGYPNIRSNANCYWGTQYPKDMYRIVGSGINIAYIVPSLDLIATLNGRTPNKIRDEVNRTFLQKLFASVRQPYRTCGGTLVNGS
jgi:CubicO group peptidase (beta-lactamase class C family)